MISANDYQYNLPSELIAQEPVEPRDSSRLFVYSISQDTVTFDSFFNLANYLPQKSFLVMNETKVLPSRITLFKDTGGKVNVLFLVNEMTEEGKVEGLVDREVHVDQVLRTDFGHSFHVISQTQNRFTFQFDFKKQELFHILDVSGRMPIPPYLKECPLSETELRKKYQPVTAHDPGSIAAPTASLHFTDTVFETLAQKGISHYFITLHVGMGTFAPIGEEAVREKRLHTEWYQIPPETQHAIDQKKQNGELLVAVGTTVVRTLESAAEAEASGNTSLFIYPPYRFQQVDGMLTNFHLPKSSLLMLVDALLKDKGAKRGILELYEVAIQEKFRFFSFGDAMLILP
ncbi:tRNA preQ1(34) S-adenosylmethionine ribosyltransferase-isomerase QueA [Candidatus Roizmanbacteria bacterium]|nr:tRNA preQ1(34) S-adenosylmethionine ribosyltransferase-isomerase QueA [Candidatus Roizmanbacteria bacterium]